MRDYRAWHDDYERPGSPLHRRLQVVIRMIRQAMDAMPAGPIRVLSLCAGQGADLLGAAEGHPRASELRGRMVELDPHNVAQARARVADLGLEVEVLEADAGMSDAYVGAAPADIVLACGIFGNISDADVERTVRFLPSLCASGARLVWTRHPRDAELFDRLQGWVAEAGFEAIELVVDPDLRWGVGAAQLVQPPSPLEPGQRIFTFVH